MHVNVRIEPRWTFAEVRRAALAFSREIERRAPTLATSKWWKEERHGVFLDYNQNAKDRTTCSAYSVRPLPDARVSTPLAWDEVPDCEPADFTVLTVPARFAELGDPHAGMDAAAGSLERAPRARGARRGGRARRRAVAAALPQDGGRGAARRALARASAAAKPRSKMPLLVVANSPSKDAALAGLERWKADIRRPPAARGRRRARRLDARPLVDLDAHPREPAHVPEALRPPQETPDPDDDPTREWRASVAAKATTDGAQRPAKIAASSCGGTTSSCA